MRCKTCDYRLWNLKARQCPECGTPFLVSDYEFIPNSIQFCCPDCGQAYYGTGYKGHLVPEAFVCVKCGRSVHMNDMVLLPTEGLEEEQTEPQRMPWLDRQQNGWWRSWLSTVRMALFSPAELMRCLPVGSSAGSAWWFLVATYALLAGVGLCVLVGIVAISGTFGGGGGPGPVVGGLSLIMVALALVPSVLVIVWAAVTHLVLRLTGGTRYGFGRTCAAVCYSGGTNVLLLVPFCGTYFHWIWWLVSAAVMLREGQRVHGLRATLALLSLPMLPIAGVVLLIVVHSGPFITVVRPVVPLASQPAGTTSPSQTLGVGYSLYQYAMNHAGQGPRHVAELVGTDLTPQSLVLPGSATAAATIPIGDLTLGDLGRSTPQADRAAALRDAITLLPKPLVAYRLGDFVFTYPGMDFHRCNRRLWTAIAWPDPRANPNWTPAEVTISRLDGSIMTYPARRWKTELAAQNILRAQNGLAPLPDPAAVLHAAPPLRPAEQEP